MASRGSLVCEAQLEVIGKQLGKPFRISGTKNNYRTSRISDRSRYIKTSIDNFLRQNSGFTIEKKICIRERKIAVLLLLSGKYVIYLAENSINVIYNYSDTYTVFLSLMYYRNTVLIP